MSFASRKLAQLQAASKNWSSRSAELAADQTDEKTNNNTTVTDIDERDRKRQKREEAKDGSSSSTAVDVDAMEDVEEEVISDSTAAEQSALAAMFPGSFGAAPKKSSLPDTSHQHASRARTNVQPPASKVKIEGATSAVTNSSTTQPKKVAMAIAPAALLGGAYDSSDDDDDDEDGMKDGGAAASSSNNTAAASSSVAAAVGKDNEDDEMDKSDDDDEMADSNPLLRSLPITHEAELKTNGHTKSVSALCLDRSGGRVLSGGYDYQCKQWDFGGMNESLASFRTFEPQEGHQIRQVTYSNSGDMFLVVTGGSRPKIYTREAVEVCQFAGGDMYIQDQKTTKGHSTAVTSGWWHPTDRNIVMTSGVDGTVRIWDVNAPTKNLSVIKPRGFIRGVSISSTCFSKDGKTIATACTDGSLRLLKASKPRDYRDGLVLQDAHVKGTETSCCLFASDDHSLFTRGGPADDTLKQWDIRAFRQPIHVLAGLPNAYPETDLSFGPDERVIVTGTSERVEGRISGSAIFVDRSTFHPLQKVSLGSHGSGLSTGVIRSVWHSGLNQLLFGCSDGVIRLLYDPSRSQKGVLMALGRKVKPKPLTDYTESIGQIHTPHALPSLKSASTNRKRQREKTAESMAPEAPVQGKVGVGGRAAGSQSMAAYHLSKHIAVRQDPRAKDPREALLAMDELAKKDPLFFGNAYKNTQPVTILAEVAPQDQIVTLTQEEINLANKKEGQTH